MNASPGIAGNMVVGLFLTLVSAVAVQSTGSEEVTIDGFVVDSQRKPMVGVTVSIISFGKKDPVKTTVTGKDGHYEFKKIRVNTTYDLWYTHTRLDPAIVESLSAKKNQHINKTLYVMGEKRSVAALQETMQTYERMMFHALAVDEEDRQAVLVSLDAKGMKKGMESLLHSSYLTSKDVRPQIREELRMKRDCSRSQEPCHFLTGSYNETL
jgi:hypothetical protein